MGRTELPHVSVSENEQFIIIMPDFCEKKMNKPFLNNWCGRTVQKISNYDLVIASVGMAFVATYEHFANNGQPSKITTSISVFLISIFIGSAIIKRKIKKIEKTSSQNC